MWQVPNQKVRAMMNARKREKERNKHNFHIRRTHAQIKMVSSLEAQAPEEVRVVLNDISTKKMAFFSSRPLGLDQVCAITIEEPRRIYVRARIMSCQELDLESKVITAQSFSYRVGVLFLFESDDEEKAFRTYCEELASEILGTNKAA